MTIKCISLNMWCGGLLMDNILAFLQEQDPDILLTQEVYNDKNPALPRELRSVEVIKERLGFAAQEFAAAFREDRKEGNFARGNAVFSKFPLRPQTTEFFNEPYTDHYVDIPENYPSSPRILQHVIAKIPAGDLNVFNMHGVWDLDGDNYSERRRRMSEVLLAATRGKANVVLAGDTNAKPTNRAMQALEQQVTSVFGTSLKSTFNMRRKDNPGYATAAVDMMFVSPELRVLACDCPDVDVSDHLPLIVTLEIESK